MAKLGFIIILLSQAAFGLEFVPLGEVRWPAQAKIGNTRFGGISALIIKEQKVFMLSDDRGLVNEPRFYEFGIKPEQKAWKFVNPKVHFLKLPKKGKVAEILDTESLLPSGEGFLVGSEGDNNKKPRVLPRIFQINKTGQWLFDLNVPSKALPEQSGMQKKGVANNFAFEAMATSPDQEWVWFTTERPLVQDVNNKDNISRFRLFQMRKDKGAFKPDHEFYFEGLEPSETEGFALVSGWSDMLYRGEKTFWLLERSLKLLSSSRKLHFECRLVEMDFSEASQVENESELSQAKKLIPAKVKKTYPLDFKGQSLGNCEGIVIGPATGDFKYTLWVVSDNNFNKSDETAVYFFGVKE